MQINSWADQQRDTAERLNR